MAADVESLLQFLHLSPVGVIDFDADGAIRHMNPAAVSLLASTTGFGDCESVYVEFDETWPGMSDAVAAEGDNGVLVADQRILGEVDGEPFALSLTLVRVAPGRHMVTVTDSTSAVDLEGALQENEERFRRLSNNSPLIVWAHDEAGAQEWVNDTFCTFFGVGRDDLTDNRWQMLTHSDDGSSYVDEFLRCVAGREPFHGEVRVRDHAGRWRWLESWGSPRFDNGGRYVGHIGTSADVTDRKRAEEVLANDAAFTSRVLDNLFTFAGVLELDGTVITVNRAPLDAAGIELVDVVGKPYWECAWWTYSGEVVEQLRAATVAAVGGELVRYDVEVAIRDNGRLLIDFQVAPLYGDDGVEVTHLVVSGLDLSERMRAQAEVESARWLAERLGLVAARLSTAVSVADVAAVAVDSLDDVGAAALDRVDGDLLRKIAVTGVDPDVVAEFETVALDADLAANLAARDNVIVNIPDAETFDRLYPALTSIRIAAGAEATLSVPCCSTSGEVLAVLSASAPEPNWFDTVRAGFVETVASLTGGALERAMLHEQAEAARSLEAMARQRSELIADVLIGIDQLDTVAEQVRCLARLLVPDFADFVTVEAPSKPEFLLALEHVDVSLLETLAALRRRHRLGAADPNSLWSVATGERLLIARVTDEMRREHVTDAEELGLSDRLGERSIVAVPINLGAGNPGAIMCGISDPARPEFNDEDLDLLSQIAVRVGLVLSATRAREREHATSLRLQRALLPERLATHPEIEVAAHYEAATAQLEVGGDWYDTFLWPDGTYAVLVGDVVGHDIEAAAAMGRIRSAANALFTDSAADPSTMLAILDRVAKGPQGSPFVTVFCYTVDPASGVVSYASAGHPPALVLSPRSEPVWLNGAQSPPLSAMHIDHRPSATHRLEPDDLVIAYTDGLIERRGEHIGQGLDRLLEQASPLAGEDVDDITTTLASTLRSESEQDDTVVVALRYAPTRPRLSITIPAKSSELAGMRQLVRDWLSTNDLTGTRHNDVLLAVGEAAANAVEHAYVASLSGKVEIRLTIGANTVYAVVKDSGRWQHPIQLGGYRGRGTQIMGTIADRFDRVTNAHGTTVKLWLGLDAASAQR